MRGGALCLSSSTTFRMESDVGCLRQLLLASATSRAEEILLAQRRGRLSAMFGKWKASSFLTAFCFRWWTAHRISPLFLFKTGASGKDHSKYTSSTTCCSIRWLTCCHNDSFLTWFSGRCFIRIGVVPGSTVLAGEMRLVLP